MKLTIIIPVYNVSQYLKACLDSVVLAAKNIGGAEIVCVNDGSTDGSGAILDAWERQLQKQEFGSVVKIVHQQNKGAAAARNVALAVAKGDWVTFVDADDLVSKEWFEVAMRIAGKECPSCIRMGLTFGKEMPSDFMNWNWRGGMTVHVGSELIDWGVKTFFYKGYTCVNFIRREIVGECRFKEDLQCKEDSLWLLNLLPQMTKACEVDFHGYFYRNTCGSLSRGARKVSHSQAYLKALEDLWSSLQKRLSAHEIMLLRDCIRVCAENEVTEWIRWRTSSDGNDKLHSAYLRLKKLGAMGEKTDPNRFRRAALAFWEWGGCDWGFKIESYMGCAKRFVRHYI